MMPGTRYQSTLGDFITADKLYRKYIEQYRCTIKRGKPATIHEVKRDDFKSSQEYLMYQKEAGMQYNGYCIDQFTPLEHHLTGTLHAEIHIAEFLVELGFVAAEAVEEKHPGLGIHSFCQALRFAGVPHEAEHIKQYATNSNHFNGKMKTFATAGTSVLPREPLLFQRQFQQSSRNGLPKVRPLFLA